MKREFFFDTADVSYIRAAWEVIKDKVDPKTMRGITTNPNAFFKIGKLKLAEWLDTIPELCKVVSEMRGDNLGIVYVQGPSSKMTAREIYMYSRMAKERSGGLAQIGIKIPPYTSVLQDKELGYDMILNVTGVADAATALKCLSYPKIRFVSIIPGRMEEAGIDANAHLRFVSERKIIDLPERQYRNAEIISGSMRTLEGLISTFQLGTVPTIGERVWNILLQDDNFEKVWNCPPAEQKLLDFSPEVSAANTKLSTDFFVQMDKCGEQAYEDLKAALDMLHTLYPLSVQKIGDKLHEDNAISEFFIA
jgi:hypothetical protein